VAQRYDRAGARAWVTEETSSGGWVDGDDHLAMGVFSAGVEADELPGGYDDGPSRVPVAEALDWARERADTVIVRLAGWGAWEFSAGERPATLGGRALPAWPPEVLDLGVRRMPGWEFLDRTDDEPPIAWEVLVSGDVVLQPRGFGPVFEQALRRAPGVEVVAVAVGEVEVADSGDGTMIVVTGGGSVEAHVRLRASTADRAADAAVSAATRACEHAIAETAEHVDAHLVAGWGASAYAAGTTAAEANVRIWRHGE